jgi:DNA polymerase III subunit chi
VTDAVFHVMVPDRVHYTCRLLRKAIGAGARVAVVGDPDTLRQLDGALWTFSQLDFLPHAWSDSHANLQSASPILLARLPSQVVGWPVVVNLGGEPVPNAALHEKVIEIVGEQDAELALARQRWKSYQAMGLSPRRHEVASAPT